MSESREGGCSCGRVRYRITGKPIALAACHCGQCQRQSGSAFGMSLVVPRDAFELLAGELRTIELRADSGTLKIGSFCGDCGARIHNSWPSRPDNYNVKPGTLDDTSTLDPPNLHVWIANKQPWVPLPDGARCFDGNPGS